MQTEQNTQEQADASDALTNELKDLTQKVEQDKAKTEHALLMALKECQYLGQNIPEEDLRLRAQNAHDLIYGVLHNK